MGTAVPARGTLHEAISLNALPKGLRQAVGSVE